MMNSCGPGSASAESTANTTLEGGFHGVTARAVSVPSAADGIGRFTTQLQRTSDDASTNTTS